MPYALVCFGMPASVYSVAFRICSPSACGPDLGPRAIPMPEGGKMGPQAVTEPACAYLAVLYNKYRHRRPSTFGKCLFITRSRRLGRTLNSEPVCNAYALGPWCVRPSGACKVSPSPSVCVAMFSMCVSFCVVCQSCYCLETVFCLLFISLL